MVSESRPCVTTLPERTCNGTVPHEAREKRKTLGLELVCEAADRAGITVTGLSA